MNGGLYLLSFYWGISGVIKSTNRRITKSIADVFFSFLLISHFSPEPICCAVSLTLYKDPLVLVLITTATEVNVDELLDGVHLLLGLLASLLLLVEELDVTSDSRRAVELGEGAAAELLLELADEGGLTPLLDGTREVLDLAPTRPARCQRTQGNDYDIKGLLTGEEWPLWPSRRGPRCRPRPPCRRPATSGVLPLTRGQRKTFVRCF